jgi:hypothetical protein
MPWPMVMCFRVTFAGGGGREDAPGKEVSLGV